MNCCTSQRAFTRLKYVLITCLMYIITFMFVYCAYVEYNLINTRTGLLVVCSKLCTVHTLYRRRRVHVFVMLTVSTCVSIIRTSLLTFSCLVNNGNTSRNIRPRKVTYNNSYGTNYVCYFLFL